MTETNKPKKSNLMTKLIAVVVIIFAVVFTGLIAAGSFYFYNFNQTKSEIEATINHNSDIYKPLENESKEYLKNFETLYAESGEAESIEEIDELIQKIEDQKSSNKELLENFKEAESKELKSQPNKETEEYRQEIENYLKSSQPYYQKTGQVLEVTQCFLENQKGIIEAENEFANLESIDTTSTETIVKGFEEIKTSINKAKNSVDGIEKCFEGEYEYLKDDKLVGEFANLSKIFSEMNGYIEEAIVGVRTQNLEKLENANKGIRGLESDLQSINSTSAAKSFEEKINQEIQEDATNSETSLNNLKNLEANLKNKYSIE